MVETAGVELPQFEISFCTRSTKIKDLIIENNPIIVKVGSDKNNMDTFTVSVFTKDIKNVNISTYRCHVHGLLKDKRFLLDKVQKAVTSTSLDGIEQLSGAYNFALDTDISEVKDSAQNWLAINQSYQQLMASMWAHMDIYPSFPLIAISRYGRVILKDFDKLKQSDPKFTFTHTDRNAGNGSIPFLNSFYIENYTHMFNLYSGYGKTVNIIDQLDGRTAVWASDASPNLSTAQDVEISNSGSRSYEGFHKTNNTHSTYHQAYFHNSSKLFQLSNIVGFLDLKGIYLKDLNVLDLVNVELGDSEKDHAIAGRYVVNTIVHRLVLNQPLTTKVFVSRDTLNNIENSILTPDTGVKVSGVKKGQILTAMKYARRCMALLRDYLNGTLVGNMSSYMTNLKYHLLNSFSINSTIIDLTSQQTALNSLMSLGRNLTNQLLSAYIPANYLTLFQTVGWSSQPNILDILNELVALYILSEYASFFTDLLITLDTIVNHLNDVSESVDAQIVNEGSTGTLMTTDTSSLEKVNSIISDIKDNTQGLDLPIPIIELTNSETLYGDSELRGLVADRIIVSLNSQGYLRGINQTEFKSILLGDILLDYNTINIINSNIGDTMYVRHWGSFSSLNELTDFFVRKSYKDEFKTVNCIKTINSKVNKQIFIALPKFLTGLVFYINSKEVSMNKYDIDLRYFDDNLNEIPYSIYYSTDKYNSTSTLLECRSV